jgi:N-acetylmuramoyl-L-alanine amidase
MNHRLLPFFICLAAQFSVVQSTTASTIDQVRIHQSPEKTRIVFDLGDVVEHRLFSLQDPMRLVVDIDDAKIMANLASVDLKQSPIENIRSSVRNSTDVRVVFDLREIVKPRSFVLKPIMQYGDRLVIDLYTDDQQETTLKKKRSVQTADA